MKLYLTIAFGLWSAVCIAQEERGKLAFVSPINDSTQVEVMLLNDEHGQPANYMAHVRAAVCEHGLCRLLVIDVFWDLLGNFLKYELPAGEALTKLDHEEFSGDDHRKMYAILSNKASILRDYPLEDLIVQQPVGKPDNVDAVSAATRVDVRDAVVGGAVYSTYVLWHIVNGPIASRIEAYSKPFLTEDRVAEMFYSDNFYYQYYALNSMRAEDSLKYADEMVHLVTDGKDYIPYFAIEKIPVSAWRQEKYQLALLQHFAQADFELQNAMLNHMTGVALGEQALAILVSTLDRLTDRQIMKALAIVSFNHQRLSDGSMKTLAQLSRHSNEQISRQINALLKESTQRR